MLNKLNDLYSKLIYEAAEDPWFRKITKDNEFFDVYLKPLISTYGVNVVKARLNTFRIGGLYIKVKAALENFKVDENYWNKDVMRKRFCII